MPDALPPSAPPAIRLLPHHLVDRIAAGEVIARPAAALKELVENALDAGARRIAISLSDGGVTRIEVIDDGAGMSAADLALAVQRHATSKLADDQLVRITTLGFRGEALPSIGAAARLAIPSRPHAADPASRITVEGGVVSAVGPAAGAPGTAVSVSDLFFATPARRTFLKSTRAEADAAELAVRRLAFAAPEVAFSLVSDGRTLFDLPAQERPARVAALLGPQTEGALLPVLASRELPGGTATLSGFAAAPSATRASAAAQSLVVNGRPVADPVLRTAIRVAYRDVIEAGRHAVVALWLDMPPEELDVNVHPTKAELRFRDPNEVRGLVISGLRAALGGGAGLAPTRPVLGGYTPRPSLQFHRPSGLPPGLGYGGLAEASLPLHAPPAARILPSPPPAPADHPLGAPLAQLLDTYILAVSADGALVLVDQHAAHERLTHEALRDQYLSGAVRTQPLLLPAVVDLAPADAARLLDRADDLARLGLEIESFGPGAILVRALPAVLGAADPAPLLRDMADELAEQGEATALDARLDAVIARLACHGSIRAGRRLDATEMDALLRRMEATPRAATCSHGRPTFLRLSRTDIERLFGRA